MTIYRYKNTEEICRRAEEDNFPEDIEYQIWQDEKKLDWIRPTIWAIIAFIPISLLFSLIWVALP